MKQKSEVRVALELSQFDTTCRGRVIAIVFDFTIEDPPTDSIVPPGVKFVPPNRFELVFRRVKANFDPAPTEPRGK